MHLFHENDRSRELYIIQSGNVKVYRLQHGREVELAIVGKGAVLGEMALIDGRPRSASAVALDTCVAIIVSADTFHSRVTGVPGWLMTTVKMTCKKIRNADRLLQSIGGRHAGINIILALSYQFSRWKEDLDVVLTRQFLVRLLNASDESIDLIVDFLCEHKFVERHETAIRLLNSARLADYCDFLRLFRRKTYELAAIPKEGIREFIMQVARELPETVAGDEKREPVVEVPFEKVNALLAKAPGGAAPGGLLMDCCDLSLCKVITGPKTEKSEEPPQMMALQIATALWRQWYLYFLYNGVIPCI